jgi:hypothetical protein
VNDAIFHCSRSATGKHDSYMFHIAACGAESRAYMDGPLPSGFVGRAANGQAGEVNNFKFAFFKRADFVRSFESLQHCFDWGHRS